MYTVHHDPVVGAWKVVSPNGALFGWYRASEDAMRVAQYLNSQRGAARRPCACRPDVRDQFAGGGG